jgi:hypothetical protein
MGPQPKNTKPQLKGFITDDDLPAAEQVWPGLHAFFIAIAEDERPPTFLDLVWRYECMRARRVTAS